MIPKERQIIPGMLVRHDEGLLYQVEDARDSTRGYGITHMLPGVKLVNYTQLEDGSYPAGTKWGLEEDEFRQYFTPLNDGQPSAPRLPTFYPFSLVLGESFRSPQYGYNVKLSESDLALRKRLAVLMDTDCTHAVGQLLSVLSHGEIRGRKVSEITPHLGKGVTFNDPNRLYLGWRGAGVGPMLSGLMRNLIENASCPQELSEG